MGADYTHLSIAFEEKYAYFMRLQIAKATEQPAAFSGANNIVVPYGHIRVPSLHGDSPLLAEFLHIHVVLELSADDSLCAGCFR